MANNDYNHHPISNHSCITGKILENSAVFAQMGTRKTVMAPFIKGDDRLSDKKSFVLYFDNYPSIAHLSAEQRGEILSTLFEYAQAEADGPSELQVVLDRHPAMSLESRMACYFMAKNIQRDTEKWREKHARYAKAARERVDKGKGDLEWLRREIQLRRRQEAQEHAEEVQT